MSVVVASSIGVVGDLAGFILIKMVKSFSRADVNGFM